MWKQVPCQNLTKCSYNVARLAQHTTLHHVQYSISKCTNPSHEKKEKTTLPD